MFEVEKTLVALGQKASDFLDSCKPAECKGPDFHLKEPFKSRARAQLNELEAVRDVDYHYK
eukprot:gene39439-48736_t